MSPRRTLRSSAAAVLRLLACLVLAGLGLAAPAGALAAPAVSVTPTCGPASPGDFAVSMDVSGFPPATFLSFDLLRSDGSRVFVGGGTTDGDGGGSPGNGLEGDLGMQQPPGIYVLRVFVDADEDTQPDPFGVVAYSAPITVPCSGVVPTVVVSPTCGRAAPDDFAVALNVFHYPAETFVSFELLRADASRVFLGGGVTDANGSGFTPVGLGFFGMQQPPGVYTVRAFVDTDLDGVPDPGGAVASSVPITVPCPEATSGDVPPGGTLSTGDATSTADLVETAVTTPTGGEVSISENVVDQAAPAGFTFLGQQVDVEAPAATAAEPLRLVFLIDGSLVPAGGPETVSVFRDGVEVAPCVGPAGVAEPDPCVAAREALPDGQVDITVLSSHASAWNIGFRTVPYVFSGFFAPVANPPGVTRGSAGRTVPVKFGLGGDQGLGVLAAGHPRSQAVDCGSGTPAGDDDGVAAAGQLSYDAASARYTFSWRTERAWAGTCRRLVMKLDDGTVHTARFSFGR